MSEVIKKKILRYRQKFTEILFKTFRHAQISFFVKASLQLFSYPSANPKSSIKITANSVPSTPLLFIFKSVIYYSSHHTCIIHFHFMSSLFSHSFMGIRLFLNCDFVSFPLVFPNFFFLSSTFLWFFFAQNEILVSYKWKGWVGHTYVNVATVQIKNNSFR